MPLDAESLLEHVLHAVMQPDTDMLTLALHLRKTVPEARVIALLRALLGAEAVIRETFNGSSDGRLDAALAHSFAMSLAEIADAFEGQNRADTSIRLRDLSL